MQPYPVDPWLDDTLATVRTLRKSGDLTSAEQVCRTATRARPMSSEAHRLLGKVLRAKGDTIASIPVCARAVELDRESPKAHVNYAIGLGEAGRLPEALEADRQALALKPGYASALGHLAQLKCWTASDPDLALFDAADPDAADETGVVTLLFGLAKVYDDLGQDDRAFSYLRRANALRRKSMTYDNSEAIAALTRIAQVFTPQLFRQRRSIGYHSQLPILITGMPRSGTTLVEQILSSHPAVHGVGEVPHLHMLSHGISLLSDDGSTFPDGVSALSSHDLEQLGYGYVAKLRSFDRSAERICDKYLHNFMFLGLARLVVPQASVIHCTRDPIDTCLSCFRLNLASIDFAFDLTELGEYYRAYSALMEHWRSVLPAGWVLDVKYEDLVADLEGWAHRIVAHCGLPWDDACLDFHTTERAVRTASFAQVRQPVYNSSVDRWRKYEAYLGPLLDALADRAPAVSLAVPATPRP